MLREHAKSKRVLRTSAFFQQLGASQVLASGLPMTVGVLELPVCHHDKCWAAGNALRLAVLSPPRRLCIMNDGCYLAISDLDAC